MPQQSLPSLCVPCSYDVDSKSPDLSKHVSSASDCPEIQKLSSVPESGLASSFPGTQTHMSDAASGYFRVYLLLGMG